MEVNELQKWNLANVIKEDYDFASLVRQLEYLDRPGFIKIEKKDMKITESAGMCKIGILDFEGSPIFCAGILIHNIALTYYIENYMYKTEFYKFVFKLLNIAKDLTFFAFSEHERTELTNIYEYLQVQGEDVSKFDFIATFPIINLQKSESKYESLTEAFYSIHPDSVRLTGDVLFRNNKLIDKLFHAQKFDEIISHNQNCLVNEYMIFLIRWYKNYKL
jgi:hypothetical protein